MDAFVLSPRAIPPTRHLHRSCLPRTAMAADSKSAIKLGPALVAKPAPAWTLPDDNNMSKAPEPIQKAYKEAEKEIDAALGKFRNCIGDQNIKLGINWEV